MPELISGSAVAAASTVAPKMTPLMPARSASALPLTSRPHARHERHRARGAEEGGDAKRRGGRERMRLLGVPFAAAAPTGPASRHRDAPAGVLARAVDHVDAGEPYGHDRDRGGADAADRRRRRKQRSHQDARHDEHDEHPLEHRRQRPDEEGERPPHAGGDVAQHEDHRLDGDPPDQVVGGETEVAACRCGHRDRQLGQAARDCEQQDAAELVAEAEAHVERVGRPRQQHARRPGRRRAGREDEHEQWGRGAGHAANQAARDETRMSAARPVAACVSLRRIASRGCRRSRSSSPCRR